MARKLKHTQAEDKVSNPILDSAHQFWLASLGAVTRFQEEGTKLFDTLVEKGEEVDARARKAANQQIEQVKNKASSHFEGLERTFQDRFSRTMKTLGIPSSSDVDELSRRVEQLNNSLQEIQKSAAA